MDTLQHAREIINEIDAEMAALFVRRMEAVETVAAYKRERGLPVLDAEREAEVLHSGIARIGNENIRGYYADFLRGTMSLSRSYQQELLRGMKLDYPIILQRGALYRADTHFDLQRKVLVVTDSGVPAAYAKAVADRCSDPVVVTLPPGEGSKTIRNFEALCRTMLEHGFTRSDCVVAVGGGMVGDLAGFAAASFMRGIDFYNVPTTVLAQVDSSVGGKVAIDLDGIKNCVGAFYQPKAVLIDPDVLQTLPHRQISAGLAEAVKMALTFDETLLSLFEQDDILGNIDEIIARSLRIKAAVVQEDEKESGLRRVLNFGHTIGHGIETAAGLDKLHHGECVALGMLPMCSDQLRPRVQTILEKLGLPTTCSVDADAVWQAIAHDKKRSGDALTVVYAPRAGSYELKKMSLQELKETVYGFLNGKV